MASKTNKQGLTVVEGTKFVATAQKLGLKVTKQAGNYRIEAEGQSGKRLYVPTTKGVHRVDLSGFTHELAVEIPEDKRPTGKVTQWLDFTQSERDILRAFYKVAKSIAPAKVEVTEPAAEITEAPAETPAEEPVQVAASEAV